MARGDNRGGERTPARPAAVSGPGALSQRTDGGPSDTQPVRVPTGGDYGEAQALEQQQQGAPLPDNSTSMPAPTGGGAGGAPAAAPGGGVWGPTDRPGESPLAGAVPTGQRQAQDPDVLARLLYASLPHPQLLHLIRRR